MFLRSVRLLDRLVSFFAALLNFHHTDGLSLKHNIPFPLSIVSQSEQAKYIKNRNESDINKDHALIVSFSASSEKRP